MKNKIMQSKFFFKKFWNEADENMKYRACKYTVYPKLQPSLEWHSPKETVFVQGGSCNAVSSYCWNKPVDF